METRERRTEGLCVCVWGGGRAVPKSSSLGLEGHILTSQPSPVSPKSFLWVDTRNSSRVTRRSWFVSTWGAREG